MRSRQGTLTSLEASIVRRPLGVAIVGSGAVARIVRVPVYAQLSSTAQVVAVCDLDVSRARDLAGQFGAPEPAVYARLEDVLEDERVDAVDVCTPHAAHAGPAIQALEAGRHVLVEKPIASTLEDGMRMVDAAARAGRVLAVNEQIRFGAGLRRAHELLEQGVVGELISVRAHRLFVLPAPYAASGWRNDPATAASGILIDQGPHYVHLLRRLAGEITHAQAIAATPHAPTALVHVKHASGVLGELLLSWRVPTPPTAAAGYAFGTEGDLEIDGPLGSLVLHRAQTGDSEVVVATEPYLTTVRACIADFLHAAAAAGAAEMSGVEGLRDLAVVAAALRSVSSGRLEQVQTV